MSRRDESPPRLIKRTLQRIYTQSPRSSTNSSALSSPRGSPELSPSRAPFFTVPLDEGTRGGSGHWSPSPALVSGTTTTTTESSSTAASSSQRRNSSPRRPSRATDNKSKDDIYAAMTRLRQQTSRLDESTTQRCPDRAENPLYQQQQQQLQRSDSATGHAMVLPRYTLDEPYDAEKSENADDSEDYDAMLCGCCILWYYNKFILTPPENQHQGEAH